MSNLQLSEKQRKMLTMGATDARCVTDPSEQLRLCRLGNRGLVQRWIRPTGHWYRTTSKGRAFLRGRRG